MNRFAINNSFGWAFFVLIFASFWSDAKIEPVVEPSANRTSVDSETARTVQDVFFNEPNDSSVAETQDSTVEPFLSDSRARSDARSGDVDAFAFSGQASQCAFCSESASEILETARLGAARRVQWPPQRRRCSDDVSPLDASTKTLFVRAFSFAGPGVFSLIYRSIWDCQSASRPLFLSLRSLRN